MNEQRMPSFAEIIALQLANAFQRYRRLLFPNIPIGFEKSDEGFLSKAALFRLMLFSSLFMAFSFLLVKALSILILTGLLRFNEINHIYSIFHISYLPGDESRWSDGNLLFIYGLPNLVFLAGGMYLTSLAVRLRKLSWIFRLLLAWIAVNLITFFMTELALSVFFYKGLGIALQWLISNNLIRIFVAIAGFIALVFWSKRFGLLFLRCLPSRIFLDDTALMRTWMIWVVLIPLFFGSAYLLIILFYSLKISLTGMLASTLITMPLAFRSIDYLPDVRTYKSKKIIPGFFFTIALMVALGIVVRLLIWLV